PNQQGLVDVAASANEFMVVWADARNAAVVGSTGIDVYGRRVAQGAPTGGARQIVGMANFQGYPSIGSNGCEFVVVVQDGRNGVNWDVYGARIDPQGSPKSNVAIATSGADEAAPSIGCDGQRYLVGYQRSPGDVYAQRVAIDGVVVDIGAFPNSAQPASEG